MPDGVRPIFCKDCLSLAKKEKKQEMESRLEAKKRELAGFSAKAEPKIGENFFSAKNQPAVSLGQAIKSGPVNFQGKKIEPSRDNFKTANSGKADQSDGTIIKENKDVILNSD